MTQRHGRHGGAEQRRWHGDLHAGGELQRRGERSATRSTDGQASRTCGDGDGERGAGERCAGGGGDDRGGDPEDTPVTTGGQRAGERHAMWTRC